MEENKNKKFLVSTIIGVLAMVIVVVGATYAYFTVSVQNNFSETKVSSKLENIGTVSLLPETTELTLNLKVDDMLDKDTNVIYFATKDGATTVTKSEVIAKASVTGAGVFNCTYDITMDATGENNMYEAVYGTNSANSIELWVDGNRFGFFQANLFPQTISGEILGLTEEVSHDIVAQFALMNDAYLIQDNLKGTDIEISFKITNFDCKNTAMSESAKYIFATSPENISTELIDGLYRYQGTQEEVTNNYICWGMQNKEECLAENSKYLYRIIGITPDGQIKIISNKLGTESYFDSSDFTSHGLTISPNGWLLYSGKNVPWSTWLISHKWSYGDITQEQFLNLSTVDDILSTEKTFNNIYIRPTGLLSYSDFFNHDTCYKGSDLNYASKCTDGWLLLNNIDESYDSSTIEWSSVRLNGTQQAFTMNGIGAINTANLIEKLNYRAVAYIKKFGYWNVAQGTGTITDPYMF